MLLATATEQGLGAIAITDHNEISGALEAVAKAEGIKVIVGEEVKTATQGEVIGLFLSEKIPRGMSLAETIAEIRRQGGLVYVPHPFDRMHAVPGYEHLLAILDEIDVIEIFNPRVAIGSFNEEAARFAGKYRLTAAAGSDAHVAAGLGLGARADARLRRTAGVPRVAARRRDPHPADEPALCPGAEVPRDARPRRSARGARAGSAACDARCASPDARSRTTLRAGEVDPADADDR